MVKELDPRFDLRAYENRFFGRLMELEALEALDARRLAQQVLDTRVRFERVLDAIERAGETPVHLLGIGLDVRRRVQVFSVLTIIGWATVVVAAWAGGRFGLRLFGLPAIGITLAVAVIGLGLTWLSILEVRRLPTESDVGRLSRYPRRLP
jgi:hypothetical protein